MRHQHLFFFIIIFLWGCETKNADTTQVKIITGSGDITLELYPKKAPETVAAFLKYVDSNYYKNGSFYRVIKNENLTAEYNRGLIQGGLYLSTPEKLNTLPGTPHEPPKQTGLSHTNGTISMARTTAGSAKTEFFICIGDQTQYDSSINVNADGLGMAAFGKVIAGMEVVRKIQSKKSNGENFETPISITNIIRD